MKADTKQRIIYVAGDYLMTAVAMVVFNIIRCEFFLTDRWQWPLRSFLLTPPVLIGIVTIPLLMLGVYYLSGYYYNVNFKSRFDEFFSTFATTFIGSMLIYFILIVNDPIDERGTIYELIGILWGVLFIFVYGLRWLLTTRAYKGYRRRQLKFNTLIVGTSQAARTMAEKLSAANNAANYNIIGFVDLGNAPAADMDGRLPVYPIEGLEQLCNELDVRKLVVMPHPEGVQATMDLLAKVFPTERQIFISPFLFQLISGKSTYRSVTGEPLVDISRRDLAPMTAAWKRACDVVVSSMALVALSPVFLAIAIGVKRDSKGPVFYRQTRIGFHKRHFKIIKFRTMVPDAEKKGPSLSAPDDPRVTRFGRFLRKYRLDELPQFVNILKGEMSLVGPRPEREFYVNQIIRRVPYYSLVHSVRPGLTSLGMVKYGYAMGVDEMVERLKYDLIYLENVSMALDFKVILYTIKTVITGKGV